jgi:hypothetical protein
MDLPRAPTEDSQYVQWLNQIDNRNQPPLLVTERFLRASLQLMALPKRCKQGKAAAQALKRVLCM